MDLGVGCDETRNCSQLQVAARFLNDESAAASVMNMSLFASMKRIDLYSMARIASRNNRIIEASPEEVPTISFAYG